MLMLYYTGLADENESVRDAALGAGHVLVEHYATTFVLKIPSTWFCAVTKDFILMRMCIYIISCLRCLMGKKNCAVFFVIIVVFEPKDNCNQSIGVIFNILL